MKRVKAKGIPVVVYEPTEDAPEFFGFEGARGLEGFEERVELVVGDRWDEELAGCGWLHAGPFQEGLGTR